MKRLETEKQRAARLERKEARKVRREHIAEVMSRPREPRGRPGRRTVIAALGASPIIWTRGRHPEPLLASVFYRPPRLTKGPADYAAERLVTP